MKTPFPARACLAAVLFALPAVATAEIHALMNYETKSPDSMKALKTPVQTGPRKEGIAIIDVDPKSKDFGKIVQDMEVSSLITRA